MVRAILDGRKTQTRRVVRFRKDMDPGGKFHSAGQIRADGHHAFDKLAYCHWCGAMAWYADGGCSCKAAATAYSYGVEGDLLWVRETWNHDTGPDGEPSEFQQVRYRASGTYDGEKWRPSIFMPRWASRISLRVIGVRVERLQEITGGDIVAEGIWPDLSYDPEKRAPSEGRTVDADFLRGRFATGWDSINAKRGYGWDVNPWVWVIEFEKVDR